MAKPSKTVVFPVYFEGWDLTCHAKIYEKSEEKSHRKHVPKTNTKISDFGGLLEPKHLHFWSVLGSKFWVVKSKPKRDQKDTL